MKQYLMLNRAFHLFPFMMVFMFALVWYILHKLTASETCLRVAIAFDQVGNAMMGGCEDETVSSRLGRKVAKGECKACKLFCRLLSWFFNEDYHCVKSIGG